MGSLSRPMISNERTGAEVVRGADACRRSTTELMAELGFPLSVIPMTDLEECGRVRETGFVWMRRRGPIEHYFKGTGTRTSYAAEVTAYVETGRFRKMSGVKSKQVMMWVPITDMSLDPSREKIYFKTSIGIGRSFPVSAFADEGEENK